MNPLCPHHQGCIQAARLLGRYYLSPHRTLESFCVFQKLWHSPWDQTLSQSCLWNKICSTLRRLLTPNIPEYATKNPMNIGEATATPLGLRFVAKDEMIFGTITTVTQWPGVALHPYLATKIPPKMHCTFMILSLAHKNAAMQPKTLNMENQLLDRPPNLWQVRTTRLKPHISITLTSENHFIKKEFNWLNLMMSLKPSSITLNTDFAGEFKAAKKNSIK